MRPVAPLAKLPAAFHVGLNPAAAAYRREEKRRTAAREAARAQRERRAAWIREQRLSPAEEPYIPADFDPAYPYPREDSA